MPLYKIDLGFRISYAAASLLYSHDYATFHKPIRVISSSHSLEGTDVIVEADDQQTVREWVRAINNELASVDVYEPAPVEGADPPRPDQDVWARTGTWSKTVGNATTTIGSLPSNPRGLIVWGSGISGAVFETPTATGGSVVFGISDGTKNRDIAYVAQHNQTTTNANSSVGSVAFHLVDPTGTNTTHIKESATASFSTNSFSLNWDATTLATTGGYFAFGGPDIIESEIMDFEVGTTTSGIIDYEGFGYVVDMGTLLFPSITGGLPWPASITGVNHALSSISAFALNQSWSTSIRNEDNASLSSSSVLQKRTYVLSGMSGTSTTEQQYARYIGVPASNDGFRLEWFNAPSAANTIFTGLFVKGGHWELRSFYQPTTPGTVRTLLQDRYAAIKGIMGFSAGTTDMTDQNVGRGSAKMTIGAQDSTGSKACLYYASADNANPSTEVSVLTNAKFMRYTGA